MPHPEKVKESKESNIKLNGKSTVEDPELIKSIINQNDRSLRLPQNGTWKGEIGNSLFIISDDAEITVRKGGEKEVVSGKQLKEKYGIEGIEYKNREPIFDKFADQMIGRIHISVMPNNRGESYRMAIHDLEERTGKTRMEIIHYMDDNYLTWHECADRGTILAIPTELHTAFPHTGGIGIQRGLERMRIKIGKILGSGNVVLRQGPEGILLGYRDRKR